MEYIQIDTIRYDTNPQKVAEFTTMTAGKLMEQLSEYDPTLPVVIRTGEKEYSLTGKIKKSNKYECF